MHALADAVCLGIATCSWDILDTKVAQVCLKLFWSLSYELAAKIMAHSNRTRILAIPHLPHLGSYMLGGLAINVYGIWETRNALNCR